MHIWQIYRFKDAFGIVAINDGNDPYGTEQRVKRENLVYLGTVEAENEEKAESLGYKLADKEVSK